MNDNFEKRKYLGIAIVAILAVGLLAKVPATQAADSLVGVISDLKVQMTNLLAEIQSLHKVLGGNEQPPVEQPLGFALESAPASIVTNFRVAGNYQQCEGVSSTICKFTTVEIKEWPSNTSTLVFNNSRATTSTVEEVVFDMTGPTGALASSSFRLFAGVSGASYVDPYSATPPTNLINGQLFVTGTQEYFSSRATSTLGRRQATGVGLVAPGQNVLMLAQHGESGTTCAADGVSCEAVTSTPATTGGGRRWKATVLVRWSWFASSTANF